MKSENLISVERIRIAADEMFNLEKDSKVLKKWAKNKPTFPAIDWPRDIDFKEVIDKYFPTNAYTNKEIVKVSVLIDYYNYIRDLILDWDGGEVLRTLDDFFEEFMRTQSEYIESLDLDWGLGLWKKGLYEEDPGRILWDSFCDMNEELKLVRFN